MAHEKLSPRQKMIGMMYLVLTAMLALNVSKEAVEAFKNVDKGLSKTIQNYAAKNSTIYEAFDRAAAQNPVKAGPARDKAYMVKQRSDELFDYIQDLKIEIIKKTEGDDTPAVVGREIIIDEVKKIDQRDVPSEVLIGAHEAGKGNDLKALIDSYREDMIRDVLEGKNPNLEESLRNIFNTDDVTTKEGEKVPWVNDNFQTLPVVAVICILSKMQVDVRNAETDLLNYLYEQIEARSYKFNKLVATVKPSSTYVMQGNDYTAEVFLTAVDTTQTPSITVGEYRTTTAADGSVKYEMVGNYVTLPIDQSGKGIYRVRATSIGQKTWGGLITIKAPDGTLVSYPFKESYSVGAPNVVISPTAMNVLYANIDNPIDISVPGVGSDKIRATMKNGTIARGRTKNSRGEFFPGEWIARPEVVGQNAQIIVSAEISGKIQSFAPMEFRVKAIPKPVAKFANVTGNASLSKDIILAQQAVFADLEGFDFDLRYNVTEFRMTYNEKGFDIYRDSKSNRITPEQRQILNSLTRGKKLYIENIKAVGPDNRPQDLSPIIITVN
ncbi:MAG TPA: gliding motility protein GldM [Bacteroidales bacterium]|nr:gliding motility protein GldM [Bacteroidales bacterium]HOK73610.1 gliding motility protein GldM [Bacteroidales bacterium]HPP92142.1 gliding motility protein GldM [Bacteroidales bacterium]